MNDTPPIQITWTVEKTLQDKPETARTFIRHGTLCVGCWMQSFCTLKDVTEIYEMDSSGFLQDLNQTTLERAFR
ncbi:MAG: hypothetical protein AB1607_06010 [Chloroflexota bacterium]